MRARAELRLRWRQWVILGVLLGIAGAVSLTAAAGARRTGGVFDRLVAATKAHDVVVQENGEPVPGLLDRIAKLPQVEAAGVLSTIPADVADRSGTPFAWSVVAAAPADENLLHRVDRPRLIAGRFARQDDPNEAMATRDSAHAHAEYR